MLINYLASAPNAMAVWIHGPSAYACGGNGRINPCVMHNVPQIWQNIRLQTEVLVSFTGPLGWTDYMIKNRYQSAVTGQWHYQFAGGQIISNASPPWVSWEGNKPSQVNNGGI